MVRSVRIAIPVCLLLATVLRAASSPWLEVPFVRQARGGCGAAAVAMVIQFWAGKEPHLADAAARTERINEALPAAGDGIPGDALKAYLEHSGFDAFVFRGGPADLENEFRKGRPLVVCFAPRGPGRPLHYAVVAGVDDESVWLHDPARGKLIREPLRRFLSAWSFTGNWSLLAVPRPAR